MEEKNNKIDNSNNEKKTENPITQGFNNLISKMQKNFKDFHQTLEEQSKKGIEKWDEKQEKVKRFFQTVKKNWDNKLNEWNDEIKRKGIETREQWEASKQKIAQDFENWQEKTKRDWEEGLKQWNKFWIKSSFLFLFFMTPILVVVIIIAIVITMVD